jgi:hypothetical protein
MTLSSALPEWRKRPSNKPGDRVQTQQNICLPFDPISRQGDLTFNRDTHPLPLASSAA